MPENLAQKLINGDRLALARAITLVENRAPGHEEILEECFRNRKPAARIGLTGAPGSGKSTLVNGIIKLLRVEEKTVGVVAVDPTSPFTGGALLGDRIRITTGESDEGVFIRSMASRGAVGGIAEATDDVAVLFEASGKEYVLIETVGVGQAEVDVAASADTTVLVLTPEGGDSVQTLKAGLMEVADVFAINKSDRPGADRMALDIRSMLEMRATDGGWTPPIVCTSAIKGENIEELLDEIGKHRDHLASCTSAADRERAYLIVKLKRAAERMLKKDLWRGSDGAGFDKIADDIADGTTTPYAAAREILDRYRARPGQGE
jgi:LAO/AO transport system kinase